MSGIAHIAADLSFSPDPHVVIPPSIAGAVNILTSAAKEPSVKRVAYTSSSVANTFPTPNTVFEITADTWNDAASSAAWAPPPYNMDRALAVYSASKVEAERACWKWVEEKKPGFAFSSVLPSGNFGPAMHAGQSSPTLTWIRLLINGDLETVSKVGMAPRKSLRLSYLLSLIADNTSHIEYFVDVRDTARLHIAALIDPSVKGERILGYCEPYNWSALLDILRKAYPDRKWPENIANEAKDLTTVTKARARSVELLQALGRKDFISLEESVKDSAEDTFKSA